MEYSQIQEHFETNDKQSQSRKRAYDETSEKETGIEKKTNPTNPFSLDGMISEIVKTQVEQILMQKDNHHLQDVLSKMEEIEKNQNHLQIQIDQMNEKFENFKKTLENSNSNVTKIISSQMKDMSDSMTLLNNSLDDDNYFPQVTSPEPNWMVEKEKCISFFEESQKQIAPFLSLYLPEIYDAGELISRAFFPEADQKNRELQAVIDYFWKDEAKTELCAKVIEKELQIQRYKVARKLYFHLKTNETCIMRKDGKVVDFTKISDFKEMVLSNKEERFNWKIPKVLIYDDYVIGAKKNSNGSTLIYKLDFPAASMTLLHTKRK